MTILNFLMLYLAFSFIPCGILHIVIREGPPDKVLDAFKVTFLPYVLYCLFTNPEKLK